ncbi:MAG: rod shape-determining protein MreD [Flavobacteriales bacterium]|nr:rod shape-determining protein MreD [Flavobacteriales bacterium]
MTELLKYVLKFIGITLLQVLLLDNVELGSYVNPFPYIYLILILPVNMGRVALLVMGFALGLTLDTFSGTGGIHAVATTLIAYYRPFLLRAQSPREGFELHAVPHINLYGFSWFVGYATLMVAIHHTVLFFLEVFRFAEFFHTLWKIILSGIFSVGIMLLMEVLTVTDRRRK